MKILILAATGRTAADLIPKLIDDNELTLFGHNVTERLSQYQDKANLVNGDLTDEEAVKNAADGQDFTVLNLMASSDLARHVVNALEKSSCPRFVVTTGHCSADETLGGQIFSNSSLNSTVIYLPWIRDNSGKNNYEVTPDDPQQEDVTQISHEEIAQFIADLTKDLSKYSNADITLKEN